VVSSTDAVLDALRIGQDALDKATSLQFKGMRLMSIKGSTAINHLDIDLSQAKRLTANVIPIITSAYLTPSCHPLLAMNRLHQSILISSLPEILTQDVLDEAIRTATRTVAGLSDILPKGHPARGIALAELGKLLAVDEPTPSSSAAFPPSGPRRLQLACEILVKARDELIIGFGLINDGGKVGVEVREALVSLERELGVWKQGVRNVLDDTS
jgi:SET and MYND domain-containing protein